MAARRRKSRKPARRKRAVRKRARRKPASARATRKPTLRRPSSTRATPKPMPRKAEPRRARPAQAKPEPVPSDHRLVAGAALEVGVVLHYYPRAGAAVVSLSRPIHRGDRIFIRGHTTDFVQSVTGLALDGCAVAEAAPSQQVGVQLEQRARVGDRVFRVSW